MRNVMGSIVDAWLCIWPRDKPGKMSGWQGSERESNMGMVGIEADG